MKTTSFVSALVLAALCAATSVHASAPSAALDTLLGEVPISQVAAQVCANGDNVTTGTPRVMVSLRLGSPNTVLRDGSWLYSGYNLNLGGKPTQGTRTLVIRFVNHAVSSLTLADAATVVALRAAPRHQAREQFLAAVQGR